MSKYFCQYCGQEYNSVFQLTCGKCKNHPNGSYEGNHILYEGDEKRSYTCKYCGQQYRTIFQMTCNKCRNHPNGSYEGKHVPSL